jgi:hypothetical protein
MKKEIVFGPSVQGSLRMANRRYGQTYMIKLLHTQWAGLIQILAHLDYT